MTTLVGIPRMLPLMTIMPSEGYYCVTKAFVILLAFLAVDDTAARK